MQFLTTDEILAVLKVAKKESTRDWLMILMAYRHGMRAGEICDLRLADIANGHVRVRRLKGSNETIQQLMAHRGNPLLDEERGLKLWLKERPKQFGDAVFPSEKGGTLATRSFNRIFHRYAALANLPPEKSHPHCLKHATANLLIRNGLDISEVQKFLGHADISSTMQYISINDAEASEKAHNAFMSAFNASSSRAIALPDS